LTADRAREIRTLPNWRIVAWPTTFAEHLVFRVGPGGHPALGNKLVRRALAYGIDRVAIAQEIQSDAGAARRRPLDSSVFLPTEPFYRPNWSGYRYDVPRARRLLAQAGRRRGVDGVHSCAGQRLSLRFVTTGGNAVRERTLQLIQADLRRVGVEVELTFAAPPVVFNQILPGGQYDAGLFAWGAFGGVAWPESRCGDVQNWAGFCSRLIMRDVQQVDRIVDPAQRARVLNAADAKLARAVPVLPVVQPLLRAIVRSNVRGFAPGGSQFNVTQTSEDWWLAGER
jgi:peptide/nickel transport system substrate-binding protein